MKSVFLFLILALYSIPSFAVDKTWQTYDLKSFKLTEIQAPKGTQIKEQFGSIKLKAKAGFDMEITVDPYGIQDKSAMVEVKKEIKDNDINKLKKYHIDTAGLILYETEVFGKQEFHFKLFGDVNGRAISVEDTKGPFHSKEICESMIEAAKSIKGFVALDEMTKTHWLQRGIMVTKQEYYKHEVALAYYNQALKMDPKFVKAYYERGVVYHDQYSQREKAYVDWEQALKLDPKFAKVYQVRGAAYVSKGEMAKAIKDLNQAIALDPKDANSYLNRAKYYLEEIETKKALKDLDKAIQLGPKSWNAYEKRGEVYYELEEYEKAVADFSVVLEAKPEEISIYSSRGLSYYRLEEYPRAIQDLTKVIDDEPFDGESFLYRGLSFYRLEEYKKAIPDFDLAVKKEPESATSYYYRGWTFEALDENEKAAADYNQYLKINGDEDGDAEEVRGWIKKLGFTPKY